MTTKHLAEGTEFPPLTNGKIRLYSMLFCPYAQRPRLVLAAKNIEYETVNINLSKKPKWYLNLNPAGTVPSLHLEEGKLIPESLLVSEYLDAKYEQNKLTPSDPYANAMQKLVIERFGKVITNFYKVFKSTEPDADKALLDSLEAVVEHKLDADFFGGEKAAYADYMIWPWLERLSYLTAYKNIVLDQTRFPKLLAYINRMKELPAVKATIISPENYDKFFQGYLVGNPEYDFE